MGSRRLWGLAGLGLAVAAAGAQPPSTPIESRALREISGVVAAARHDGLWALTDSGTPARLYAIGLDGRVRQQVRVRGARNRDWEALGLWRRAEGNLLIIGDIGDNRARRDEIQLYVVPEPGPLDEVVEVSATITLQYPDGARDAEALAVDPSGPHVVVLSKRDQPPRLYSAPLTLSDSRLRLTPLGPVTTIPPPTATDRREDPAYGDLRSQPVGMDISLDATRLVIGTYKDAYVYRRDTGESWAQSLSRPPLTVDTPQLKETQAAALHGAGLITASEGRPARLAITPLP